MNSNVFKNSRLTFRFPTDLFRPMPNPRSFQPGEAPRARSHHSRLRSRVERELTKIEPRLGAPAPRRRKTVRPALAATERSLHGGTTVPESATQPPKAGLDVFALVIPESRAGYYPSLQRGFHEASAEQHNQVI